uniref:Tagatose-bisphosphate aldolase n=1 Tax=Candidatus Enterococcus dunnyi TaxID=1834192 RepID=A0A200JCQ1_9ENTE|nr:hypothetical protein A5889_000461 [Enterococcus sp. 9D6_DIV0238]
MIKKASGQETSDEAIIHFKELVYRDLTPYASAILLDPEYGLSAAALRDLDAGLLIANEAF